MEHNEKCQCCEEEVPEGMRFELPCGAKVCESCFIEDFWSGEDCNRWEPGTSPDCLDCIFSLVTTGPGFDTFSDALPGF